MESERGSQDERERVLQVRENREEEEGKMKKEG